MDPSNGKNDGRGSIYKEYEKRVKAIVMSGKNDKDALLFFPKDNLDIKKEAIKRNKNEKVEPENCKEVYSSLPKFSRKAISFFRSPKVQLDYNYKKFEKIETTSLEKKVKSQKYNEVDKDAKKELETAEKKIKKKKGYVTSSASKLRKKIKGNIAPSLVYIYDKLTEETEYEWDGGTDKKICKRIKFEQLRNLDQTTFLLNVKKFGTAFTTKFGDIEPLFLSFTLVDIDAKKKISETYYVDLNDDGIIQNIKKGGVSRKENSNLKYCIFKVSKRSSNIVLLCQLTKVLEGNEDDVSERYVSPEKFKDGDIKKFKKSTLLFCERYGFLRQPIAYTMISVFDDDENLVLGKENKHIFYRCSGNQDLVKLVTNDQGSSRRSLTSTKKIKTINCQIDMEALVIEEYNPIYLDDPGVISIKGKVSAREVEEFEVVKKDKVKNKYQHYLFLYPRQLHFKKKGLTGSSPKNITIRIQYKVNDAKLNDPDSSKVIFGRSSQNNLIATYYTMVSVGKKNPDFGDEIKIALPAKIEKNHHILFSFYNVQLKAKSNVKTLTCLGHSVLQVLEENDQIVSKVHSLDIFDTKKKEDYLRKMKKKGGSFKIKIRPLTTIYSPQKRVAEAFTKIENIDKLIKAFDKSPHYILNNLFVVFNYLFETLSSCSNPKYLKKTYFTILDLIEKICQKFPSENQRNHHILEYVQNVFKNPSKCKENYPFFQMCHLWLQLIRDEEEKRKKGMEEGPEKRLTKSLQYCWFSFDIIIKSIILYMKGNNIKGRLNDESWNRILEDLVSRLAIEVVHKGGSGLSVSKELNQSLAIFFKDLLNVMDRGFVLYLIDLYLNKIKALAVKQRELIQELKIIFLQIISDYEHYVPMSLPKKYKITSISIENRLCDLTFLCGMVIRRCVEDIKNPERTVRQRSFNLIKDLLTKHAYDIKYEEESIKKRVIGMYFPFVLFFIEEFEEYKEVAMKHLNSLEAKKNEFERELNRVEQQQQQKKHEKENYEEENKSKGRGTEKKGGQSQTTQFDEAINELEKEIQAIKIQSEESTRKYEEELIRVKAEYQHVLMCNVIILLNMDRSNLSQWFKVETSPKLIKFISLLSDCITYFEYRGKKEITEKEKKYGSEAMSSEKTLRKAKEMLEEMYSQSLGGGMNTMGMSLGKSTLGAGAGDTGMSTFGNRKPLVRRTSMRTAGRTSGLQRPQIVSRRSSGMSTLGGSTPDASAQNGSTLGQYRKSLKIRSTIKRGEERKIDPAVLKKKIKWEGILGAQVAFVVLDLLIDLLKACRDNTEILQSLFDVIVQFFESNQSDKVMDSFFDLLKVFIDVYRPSLYLPGTAYSEKLCFALLKKCHSLVEKTRSKATGVLYLLIRNNYLEMGNFARTRNQTTTGLSSIVSDLDEHSSDLLNICFKTISKYSLDDSCVGNNKTLKRKKGKHAISFPEQVLDLIEKLKTTLSINKDIQKYKHKENGKEKLVQLYIEQADSYIDNPTLRVIWFNTLAQEHEKGERYVEGGECYLLIAGYAFMYLRCKQNKLFTKSGRHALDYSLLSRSCSYLRQQEFTELFELFKDGVGPTFSLSHFTVNGMIENIKKAIKLFEKGKYYEYNVNLYKFLISYEETTKATQKKYANLQSYLNKLSSTYKTISKCFMERRIFGTYYLLGFYGHYVGKEENGKQFIYKFKGLAKLLDVMNYVQNKFKEAIEKHGIKTKIRSSSFVPTEEDKKQKELINVQIINISPYEEENEERETFFDKNQNIEAFIFETPFTKQTFSSSSGKAKTHARTMEDQWKRKVINYVQVPFPGITTKAQIIKQKTIELTPIENAIEVIDTSNTKLQSFLKNKSKVDTNSLQLVLSGTLIPQVAEGIPAIIKVFLTEKYESSKFIKKLHQSFRSFIKLNLEGVKINDKFKKPNTEALQKEFINGYKKLYTQITQKISGCEAWDPKNHF